MHIISNSSKKWCFIFQFNFIQVSTSMGFFCSTILDFILLVSNMCRGFQLCSYGQISTKSKRKFTLDIEKITKGSRCKICWYNSLFQDGDSKGAVLPAQTLGEQICTLCPCAQLEQAHLSNELLSHKIHEGWDEGNKIFTEMQTTPKFFIFFIIFLKSYSPILKRSWKCKPCYCVALSQISSLGIQNRTDLC